VAGPCHAAAKSTSLLTLELFKECAFSTCLSEIGRVGGKRKPLGPDVRSSLGLGSFGTAGEELATEIDLQFWRKNFTHL
jgi:hypothetical protein